MIYPTTIEQKIGFDLVRKQVAELCTSVQGREHCDNMSMSTDYKQVRSMLEATDEAVKILAGANSFALGAIHDLRVTLGHARVAGAFMTPADLMKLRGTLGAMSDVVSFFNRAKTEDGSSPYPRLQQIADKLATFPNLISEIDRVLDRGGNVKDSASPELAACRRQILSMNGKIAAAMRRVLASAIGEGIVDADTTPAIRDGRQVIPVSPMNKRRIAGIVHDESASGKTYYIEPAEVVEANNRLRELEIEEHHEVVKVLTAVTAQIRPYADDIENSTEVLASLDFIFAKARYAMASGACLPHLSDKSEFEWYGACHPVLRQALDKQGKAIVPLDIRITADKRILIVSGPNAGGKSVALKTVGIVQYMMQCGMLPTVFDHSTMGLFTGIFVDIGDDQSIEDDLSTYSSHLRNMKMLLNTGNKRTLALIDEFGSGTEPQIGGAIAQALLQKFNDSQIRGVITTHFRNLKQFAEDTPGLVNGSMLYDRHLMKPLFKLSIGSPGSSFAVEIARKIGLPSEIIDEATKIVGSDYINADKYLLDINRDRRYWENKRETIKDKEKKLNSLLERYTDDADALQQQRRKIIEEARREAARIIEGSNAAIERTIHDIRQAQADKEKTQEARRRLADQHGSLTDDSTVTINDSNELLSKAEKAKKHRRNKPSTPSTPKEPETIKPGDNVVLEGSTTVGTVSAISGKTATVVFGNLTTTTDVSRLKRTIRKADSGRSKSDSFISSATTDEMRNRQLHFNTEIDVRGMRADEAVQAVTYFIDDAVQFGIQRVRILHGTGTGALRQSIRQYLAGVKTINTYHDEDVRFGGAGITVVEI